MADRLSSYSMMNNFSPGMLGHHQMQQMQQQQQQRQPQDSMQNFANSNPIWPMQHMQNQFRGQNGSDMNGSQVNPQMADLLRSQNLARAQQQQQQQPFPLGQAPPFHDQQNPPQSQNHLAQGFPNPSFNNPPMNMGGRMMPFHNNPGQQQRQLELLASSRMQQQNQNPLNGQPSPMNQMNQPPQPDLFGSPSMVNDSVRRPSPMAPHAQPPPHPNMQMQPKMLGPQQLPQIQQKYAEVIAQISNLEGQANALSQARAGTSDAIFTQKMRMIQEDIARKRDLSAKLGQFLTQARNMNNNPPGPSAGQPGLGQPQQPPWPNQPGPPQPPSFGMHQPNQSNIQSSPAPHHPNAFLQQQNNRPPVSQPQPNPPFPNNMSTGNQFPFQTPNPPAAPNPAPNLPGLTQQIMQMMTQLPPPLEKQRFEITYKQFATSRGLQIDPSQMVVDNRPVDIYTLHCAVFNEGGPKKVVQNDAWALVAGRMGFVQFPGGPNEGPKSGPATADRISNIYKMYLHEFDQVYIRSVVDQRKKMITINNQNQVRPPHVQMILSLADKTSDQLRLANIPENMIDFIEKNRVRLQQTAADQTHFQAGIRPQPNLEGNPQFSPPKIPAVPTTPSNNMPQIMPPRPALPANPVFRNSAQQIQLAMSTITKAKADIQARHLPSLRQIDVPTNQRLEYNHLIEQLHRYAGEIDSKLSVYFPYLSNRDQVHKLLSTIVTVQQQRTMLQSNNPRFIISLDMLKVMMSQFQQANETFTNIHSRLQGQATGQNNIQPGPPRPNGQPSPGPPQPPHTTAQIPNRPIVPLRNPPTKQAPTPKTSTPPPVALPSPAASVSTPAAAASPPTPKSPKGPKAPTKKAPVKPRRTSKVAPAPTNDPAPSPPNNVKRPREEEVASSSTPGNMGSPSVANEPSPPKRPKTEWEGPSEALQKQNEAVENAVKSEENAVAFFEQMSELLRVAANNEGQESTLTSDLSDTLDMLLKGCGAVPDAPDPSLALMDMRDPSPAPVLPSAEELGQFFDFSSFVGIDDDDSASKAPTPDLSTSSSTNPSPESVADLTSKTEELTDPLRLGTLKEIDGGESAYYHSNEWKYDGAMPILEQPWAIFTS